MLYYSNKPRLLSLYLVSGDAKINKAQKQVCSFKEAVTFHLKCS